MIRLEGVSKLYRTERVETTALDNVNLEIERGSFVSIMGPSGCGKSTLLNLIGLLDEPSQGKVVIDGAVVDRYDDRSLARLRNEQIGFIFQQFHLVSDLKVVDNVEIPLLYRTRGARLNARERRAAALAALDARSRRIVEARWLARNEIAALLAGERRDDVRLPPRFTIARRLIERWASQRP